LPVEVGVGIAATDVAPRARAAAMSFARNFILSVKVDEILADWEVAGGGDGLEENTTWFLYGCQFPNLYEQSFEQSYSRCHSRGPHTQFGRLFSSLYVWHGSRWEVFSTIYIALLLAR
jgi:hypothetical protein